jgi:hypothetical protein
MQSSRRVFLLLGIPVSLAAAAAAAQRAPRWHTVQPGSGRTQNPADLNLSRTTPLPKADPRLLKEKQEEIKKQVQQLFNLASELKTEAEKTDSASVLSLPVLKKAEQIQKIAKHIQSLARG